MQTLISIAPPGARSAEQAKPLIALAKQAGVQKVVRLSAIKASEDGPTNNTRQHTLTERSCGAERPVRWIRTRTLGPKSITHGEVAAAIATALGRDVAYVPLPPEAVGESLRALGLDDWTAQLIIDYSRAYSSGFGDFVTDSVQQLTGHAPRSIATFAAEVIAPMAESCAS